MKKLTTWLYRFEDGYFCYTTGKMSKIDLAWEKDKHGAVVEMRQC